MLTSLRRRLSKVLDSELTIENERLLDVNDDCLDGMKVLIEEGRELKLKIEALEKERDALREEVELLKKKLAPKTATERKFREIDLWD